MVSIPSIHVGLLAIVAGVAGDLVSSATSDAAPRFRATCAQADASPAPLVVLEPRGARSLARAGVVYVAGSPTLGTLEALARDGVRVVVDLRPADERGEDLAPERLAALGMRPLSLPLPADGAPSDALLDDVRRVLEHARREPASGGVLLHDGGADGAAAAWLASRALDEGVAWESALVEARHAGLRTREREDAVRCYVLGAGRQELGRWKETIRAELPDVKRISVDELATRLAQEGPKPLLLDARGPAELAVSRLPNARPAPDLERALAQLQGEPRGREVVVYCSIGYRSARLARALGERGFTDVRNLEGSIFEWANTGHPVYRGDAPVREVHPYDRTWGRMLERELWSWEPR